MTMVVTFAGYDIKVGTPVVGRDGAEVGTVAATEGNDLVVDIRGGERMAVSEQGVAAFEPDFVKLDQDSEWILGGNWRTADEDGYGVVDADNKTMDVADTASAASSSAADDRRSIDLHREDLVATKREVATGLVKVVKRVVVNEEALDVDIFNEKLKVARVDLDRDGDLDHAFEEESYEIELHGEEVDLGKRVRVIGQVDLGKERLNRTERMAGQVRHEEVDVDEVAYPVARPVGADRVVADTTGRERTNRA